jgi:hypothetical protein
MFDKTFYSVVFDQKDFTCGQLRARLDISLQSGQALQLKEFFFEPSSLKKGNDEKPSINKFSDLFLCSYFPDPNKILEIPAL